MLAENRKEPSKAADVWNRDTRIGNGNHKFLRESQVN
jgi:hypothetical protein